MENLPKKDLVQKSLRTGLFKNHNKGFSLVELSISLTILSILVCSVLTIQQVRSNAILYSIIDRMGKLNFAYAGFKMTYGLAPGDLSNATSQFGSSISYGNGNGLIDSGAANSLEPVLSLQHLSLAGFIQGSYCGNWNISNSCLNIMPNNNAIAGAGFYFSFASSTSPANGSYTPFNYSNNNFLDAIYYAKFYDQNANLIYDQWPQEETYSVLSPIDAAKIDNKYDDSLPKTGNFIAANGLDVTNGCISSNSYQVSAIISCYVATLILP